MLPLAAIVLVSFVLSQVTANLMAGRLGDITLSQIIAIAAPVSVGMVTLFGWYYVLPLLRAEGRARYDIWAATQVERR